MTSLDLLNIVVFWRIVDDGSIQELDLNYRRNKVYNEQELNELGKHWAKLYDQFYEYRSNKSGKYLINKNYELAQLSLKLQLLSDIENRLILLLNIGDNKVFREFIKIRTVDVVNDFKKLYPKVRISVFDSITELLTVVQSVIKSQTNIFDEKTGAKENVVQKQRETIYEIVAMMSKILGYSLNINTMSCMEFLGHENLINSTSKK